MLLSWSFVPWSLAGQTCKTSVQVDPLLGQWQSPDSEYINMAGALGAFVGEELRAASLSFRRLESLLSGSSGGAPVCFGACRRPCTESHSTRPPAALPPQTQVREEASRVIPRGVFGHFWHTDTCLMGLSPPVCLSVCLYNLHITYEYAYIIY